MLAIVPKQKTWQHNVWPVDSSCEFFSALIRSVYRKYGFDLPLLEDPTPLKLSITSRLLKHYKVWPLSKFILHIEMLNEITWFFMLLFVSFILQPHVNSGLWPQNCWDFAKWNEYEALGMTQPSIKGKTSQQREKQERSPLLRPLKMSLSQHNTVIRDPSQVALEVMQKKQGPKWEMDNSTPS